MESPTSVDPAAGDFPPLRGCRYPPRALGAGVPENPRELGCVRELRFRGLIVHVLPVFHTFMPRCFTPFCRKKRAAASTDTPLSLACFASLRAPAVVSVAGTTVSPGGVFGLACDFPIVICGQFYVLGFPLQYPRHKLGNGHFPFLRSLRHGPLQFTRDTDADVAFVR